MERFKSSIPATEDIQLVLVAIYGDLLKFLAQATIEDNEQRKLLSDTEDKEREACKAQDALRKEILGWIPHRSFDSAQDEKHSSSLENTGQWFFDHNAFRAWKYARNSGLLWVTGTAGSGKSHLAAHTIHNIGESCRSRGSTRMGNQGDNIHALAFLYCSSDGNTSLSSDAVPERSILLGSLLRQLYDRLRRAEIRDAIRSILGNFTRGYIVVDELDECSGLPGDDFKDFCWFLGALTRNCVTTSTRVVIFSRPGYPVIADALSNAIQIQVDNGSNIKDIEAFIDEKTADLAKRPSALKQIQSDLLKGADGVFLWASLSIRIIELETSDRGKMTAAKNSVRGLEELYSKLLQRVLSQPKSRRDLALKALLWVATALKPLGKNVLVHTLSFEPGMEWMDSDDMVDENVILSSCADLLVEKEDRYELLHFSLAEFLKTDSARKLIHPKCPGDMENRPSAVLAKSCMGYLLLKEFQKGPVDTLEAFMDLLIGYPLLLHAAILWGDYLRSSMTPENIALACQISFADEKTCAGGEDLFPWPGKATALHAIAYLGLEGLIDQFPQARSQINVPDGFSWFPIDYATSRKQKPMVEWILSQPGSIGPTATSENLDGDAGGLEPLRPATPLVLEAAWNGWADIENVDVAEVLTRETADPNALDKDGTTPLMLAVKSRRLDIAKLLLKCGANVNLRGKYDLEVEGYNGATPMLLAVFGGNATTMECLLSRGANFAAKEKDNSTILHFAGRRNKYQPMEFLLSRWEANGALADTVGSNKHGSEASAVSSAASRGHHTAILPALNHEDAFGDWPIHHAARYGQVERVQALRRLFPDQVDHKTRAGGTPLCIAAWRKKLPMVEFLLERGANVNAMFRVAQSHWRPLHSVILDHRTDIATALLRRGADPNLRNGFGDTAWDIAARVGGLTAFRSLLDHHSGLRSDQDRLLCTIKKAILYQNIEVFDLLLSLYGDSSLLSKMEKSCCSLWMRQDLAALKSGKG
ncbi:hypothetical protein PG994_004111 [Apiospora phragmitis]|uniref:Nephrocystin 3-like N-terminal domain-containing protein n=1 Tax=Apiospora phragmitis TaxID=2905665 RepID=A0ABR1VPY3_9PEZI